MTRVLKFDGSEKDRFDLLFGGFLQGGNALLQRAQGQRTRDERSKEAKILKALKSISTKKTSDKGETWVLNDTGGELNLDQSQHSLLLKYIEAAPFPTYQSDDLVDLLDWVDAAEKVE